MKSTMFCLCAVFCAGSAIADDATKAAPGNYKMVIENDRVRVLEVTIKAGENLWSN